jgi:hypothetical protein
MHIPSIPISQGKFLLALERGECLGQYKVTRVHVASYAQKILLATNIGKLSLAGLSI